MKTFLKYIIGLLILLAILAIAAMYFSPKQLKVEESITIDSPPAVVFNIVNNFKQWDSWSPFLDKDPNAVKTYTDKTTGVGAQWTWKGNKEVGSGSQKIIESTQNEQIRTALEFGEWDGTAHSQWNFAEEGGKTKVVWSFEGAETSFFLRPFNWLMKSGLKSTFKTGLGRIKKLAEDRHKKKEYGGYKINEVYQGAKHYVMNREIVDINKISQFYTQNITSLFSKAQGITLDMDGKDSALFYSKDRMSGKTDMAAALPLKAPVTIPGAISQTISDSKVLQVDYYGDRDKTLSAHNAISDYMKDAGLLINYPIVEEYVTDPTIEKDPAKWLTKITYYITNSTQ